MYLFSLYFLHNYDPFVRGFSKKNSLTAIMMPHCVENFIRSLHLPPFTECCTYDEIREWKKNFKKKVFNFLSLKNEVTQWEEDVASEKRIKNGKAHITHTETDDFSRSILNIRCLINGLKNLWVLLWKSLQIGRLILKEIMQDIHDMK